LTTPDSPRTHESGTRGRLQRQGEPIDLAAQDDPRGPIQAMGYEHASEVTNLGERSIYDHPAITVEAAEMDHAIHGGHDDRILVLGRDMTYAVRRGHQSQVKPLAPIPIRPGNSSSQTR
jgi:hypothetical protein